MPAGRGSFGGGHKKEASPVAQDHLKSPAGAGIGTGTGEDAEADIAAGQAQKREGMLPAVKPVNGG